MKLYYIIFITYNDFIYLNKEINIIDYVVYVNVICMYI